MPLHIDYRPKTLDEFIGNDAVKKSLKSIFEREKDRPHSYLFSGPSGCGKTTLGRILANMLGCSEMDFHEYNMSNMRGIDTVREITQNCHYSGLASRTKIYLLDEVHRQTPDAQNAILKVLEDTPSHVYFILCTTEPEKLIKTILTRCTTYNVKPLTDVQMKKLITWVLNKEKISDFFPSVEKEIISISEGCPRQALVILDQVIDVLDEQKALEVVVAISIGEAEVIDICRGIISGVSWGDLKEKVRIVLQNTEPEKVRYAILGYFSAVLLNSKKHDRASEIIDMFSENTYYSGKAGIVNAIYLCTKR